MSGASVRAAGEHLESDAPYLAGLVFSAAQTIEQSADQLRGQSIEDLARSTAEFARQRPEIVFGVAAVSGFLLFRLLNAGMSSATGPSYRSGGRLPASIGPSPPELRHFLRRRDCPMAEENLWETRLVRAVTDLGTDLADLVQKELRLARTEIVQKLTLGLQAGAWFAVAAVLGFFAVVLILEALVFGIAAAGIPLWGSCLLVAFMLSVLAAIAFYYARRQSSRGHDPGQERSTVYQGDWHGKGTTPMNYQQISNQTGDWFLDTVQRKPEALLLIAAGCALLMRSGRPV